MDRHITPFLKVIQINANRQRNVLAEIASMATQKGFHLAAIQEPPTAGGKPVAMPGWARSASKPIQEGKVLACLTLMNPRFCIMGHPTFSTNKVAAATVAWSGGMIKIISCYCPPNEPLGQTLDDLTKALDFTGRSTVICGDFNAWHVAWGSNRTNHRGQQLMDYITSRGLEILNPQASQPTYMGPRGNSCIDLTLITPDLLSKIRDWEIRYDTSSDHSSIQFCVEISRGSWQPPPRMPTKNIDWAKFKACLQENFPQEEEGEPRSKAEIDEAIENLSRNIKKAAVASSIKGSARKKVPWWSDELTTARVATTRARAAHNRVKKQGGITLQESIATLLQRAYRRKIVRARKTSWRTFVEENGPHNPWGIPYKAVTGSLCEKCAPASIPFEGTMPRDPVQSFENLLKSVFPDDDPSSDTPEQAFKRARMRMPPGTEMSSQWDEIDLEMAVKKQNPNGAPGHDLIEARMIAHGFSIIKGNLLNIMNACLTVGYFPVTWKVAEVCTFLKKGPRDPSEATSYRPISLLPVLGKILESLVMAKLNPQIRQYISPRQFGNVKGRSPEDAIRQLFEDVASTDSKYAITIFVDVVGAFDHAWWPEILAQLQELDTPSDLFCLISSFLEDRVAQVTTVAGVARVAVSRGCPQGSIKGPPLWKIKVNPLLVKLERLGIKSVGYVDDLAMTVFGNSRAAVLAEASRAITAVLEWSNEVKLELSSKKTVAMVMRGNFDAQHPPRVKLGRENLTFTEEVTYLGVTFCNGCNFRPHIDTISSKANKIINALVNLSAASWGLNYSGCLTVYKGAFLGAALYACSAWWAFMKRPNWESLRRSQRAILIRVLKAYRTTSTEALQAIAAAPPIDLEVIKRVAVHNFRRRRPLPGSLPQELGRRLATLPEDRWDEAKTLAEQYMAEEWEKRWSLTRNAGHLKKFFPTIKDRVTKEFIRPSHWTLQLLTGHGKFADKLHFFKCKETNLCQCGLVETPDHVIFTCALYDRVRILLYRSIGEYSPSHQTLVASEKNFTALQDYAKEWSEISTT